MFLPHPLRPALRHKTCSRPSDHSHLVQRSGDSYSRWRRIPYKEGAELTESPRPLLSRAPDSIHPGLRPALMDVPVTPGIDDRAYKSGSSDLEEASYFTRDIHNLTEDNGGNTKRRGLWGEVQPRDFAADEHGQSYDAEKRLVV